MGPFHNMKLWASRRTETPDDAERPTAVEALGTEMIAPDGEVSVRAEVEVIAVARGRSRSGGGAGDWRGGGGALGFRL
jgi:hypothetical protein